MFTYGGSGIPFGIVSSQDVHVCRLEPGAHTVTWSQLAATGDVPEKKYGHVSVHKKKTIQNLSDKCQWRHKWY